MRSLSLATVFAAISGFAVLFIAPKILTTDLTAEFMAYWGLFFAGTGLIDGITQETTRAVSSHASGASAGTARPVRFAGAVGLIVGIAVLLTSPLWIGLLVSSHDVSASVLLAGGLILYACQAAISGLLSGLKLWDAFAALLALDSGIRFLLVLIAWRAGWGLPAFFVITVIGAVSWIVILLAFPDARKALRAATDVPQRVFNRNAVSAMLATGATAVLITGFPVFVKTTLSDAPTGGLTLAGIMMAVTLTRAPILVPLQRFQAALIVRFVENRDKILGALFAPIVTVLGVGLCGGALAWLVGPWIMETLWGPDFHVPGLVLAVLTFASACAGALMISGAATMAEEQHRIYVLGWVVASVVAFGLLLSPFDLATNVCLSLLCGPIAGVLVHLYGLRAAR